MVFDSPRLQSPVSRTYDPNRGPRTGYGDLDQTTRDLLRPSETGFVGYSSGTRVDGSLCSASKPFSAERAKPAGASLDPRESSAIPPPPVLVLGDLRFVGIGTAWLLPALGERTARQYYHSRHRRDGECRGHSARSATNGTRPRLAGRS